MPNPIEPLQRAVSATKTLSGAATPVYETPLSQKWTALAGQPTAEGWSIQDYLGTAVGAPQHLAGNGAIQTYQRGAIVLHPKVGAAVVYGKIYARYLQLGGPIGFLGIPTSDERATANGGRCSSFDGGEIYWSAASGTREVHGAIRDRWLALGGPGGVLGYPTSDECPVLQNGKEIGRSSSFANGTIYWTAATGAQETYGAIRACYNSFGGPTGALGFPTSGETSTPDSGGRYNEFERGIIVWHPDGPYAGAKPVFDLTFELSHFESDWGSYHVQSKVDATNPAIACDTWYPSDSDYTSNPTVDQAILHVPVVNATTAIDVWMDALGQHNLGIGEDERLGKVTAHYNIANLWGLIDTLANPRHDANLDRDDGHTFTAIYTVQTRYPIDPNAAFRATYFWPFLNPNTPIMSDATYASTFSDVHEGESWEWHPFDQLFYNLVYKTIGKHGDCFGTCLEALYALAGRSVFPEPIYNNPYINYGALQGGSAAPVAPGDNRFLDPIDIKHGYQLGIEVVNDFLVRLATGRLNDATQAFDESFAAAQAGEHGILSLSQDGSLGSAGHAVLPYAWQTNGDISTISIANPNAPYGARPDSDPACTITIHRAAKTFSFVMAYNSSGPATWSGGPGGGRIFFIPFSKLNAEPATPYGDVQALIEGLTFFIVGDGASSTQVSDDSGRTLFDPSTPKRFQSDATKRVANLALIPPINAPTPEPIKKTIVNDPGVVKSDVLTTPAKNPAKPVSKEIAGDVHDGAEYRLIAQPAEFYCLRQPMAFKRATSTAPPAAGNSSSRAALANDAAALKLNSVTELATTKAYTWQLSSTPGSPYTWAMRGAAGAIIASIPASTADDLVHVQYANATPPTISLAVAAGGTPKLATLTVVGPARGGAADTRVFEVGGVPMATTSGVSVRLDDAGTALVIDNPGAALTLSISLSVGSNASAVAKRPVVVVAANATTRLAPADWSPANLPKTTITLEHLDRTTGAVLAKQTL